MHFIRKNIPLWIALAMLPPVFLLGVWANTLPLVLSGDKLTKSRELREHGGRFTSPLLECEVFGEDEVRVLKSFKYKVEALLQEKIAEGVLVDGSVYFRDLNNGMWFGINEGMSYRPASMMKVPVMIAYFKLAGNNPALLGKTIQFKGGYDLTKIQGVRPSGELEIGKSYSIEELIYRMIALSDNNAAQLLVENIDQRVLDQVIADIDVNVNLADYEHMMTAHAYAGFFRVLYNASYLNRVYSERALEILSRSRFVEGIRAGLPPDLVAATKFGEWGDSHDSEIVQTHEFGIVYYPRRPYLLGVMSRGRRGAEFNRLIGEVSHLIFSSMEEQARGASPR